MTDNFIRSIVQQDLENGLTHVQTRFPPEPNGYLHLGHVKAIHLNFSLAQEFNGACNLRMDDTNPEKEEQEYIDAICEDIRWLGYSWNDEIKYASDYFEQFHAYAVLLIKKGFAYVDALSFEEIRKTRGTPTEHGVESPWRNRAVEENLELFAQMRAGEHPEGSLVLRAKIDMKADNINLRDPLLYRIRYIEHPRTGNVWCIYPLYDFAHSLSDAIEQITHSLCTLEFENHRPLYDWIVEHCECPHKPRQIEFAKLHVSTMIMSKRRLNLLISEEIVSGWDDPRMPTLAGLRRRGYPSQALLAFVDSVGLTKTESLIDIRRMEHAIREHLNEAAQRRMVVFDPIELVITNLDDDFEDVFTVENNPERKDDGSRNISFSKQLYIERDDFMVDPPKKYFRLSPGASVRLKFAYCVNCHDYESDAQGQVTRVFCTVDPATRGGDSKGQKIRGTLHWVAKKTARVIHIHEYAPLFTEENPSVSDRFLESVNPDSLKIVHAFAEPAIYDEAKDTSKYYQFLRKGYYRQDTVASKNILIFNSIVGLRDTWQKLNKPSR